MPTGPYGPPDYDVYDQYPTAYGAVTPLTVTPTTTLSSAPVLVPITRLFLPLNPLSYYLLGQLEYYLSKDNLAHDLYLCKNVSVKLALDWRKSLRVVAYCQLLLSDRCSGLDSHIAPGIFQPRQDFDL